MITLKKDDLLASIGNRLFKRLSFPQVIKEVAHEMWVLGVTTYTLRIVPVPSHYHCIGLELFYEIDGVEQEPVVLLGNVNIAEIEETIWD